MKLSIKPTLPRLLVYLVFLLLPTLLVMLPVFAKLSGSFIFLQKDVLVDTLIIASSLFISFSLYFYRLRFWVSFLPLVFGLFTIYKGVENYYPGEFDSFFATIRIGYILILILLSWLIGYGLAAYRFFPQILSVVFIAGGIINLSGTKDINTNEIVWMFFPIVLYAFYCIFIKETLENVQTVTRKQFLDLSIRFVIFISLVFALYWLAVGLVSKQLKAIDQEITQTKSNGTNKEDEESLLRRNGNNELEMNEYSELKSKAKQQPEDVMFVTYLDNFFPGTVEAGDPLPNPLYYVMYHFSKYDEVKEKFSRDPEAPYDDEFNPDPTKIPLFISLTDSSILKFSNGYKLRKVVESEVYSVKLPPNGFTAPGTAFACQPITVDPDFKEKYLFAYKAKSYVSELNSAYFVYNAGDNEQIKAFQSIRNTILRQVKDYESVDCSFTDYYTSMPKGPLYDSIKYLAQQITKNAKTPIDKVLKIKDYFFSKDANGKPLFKYTLTPGKPTDPNIPSSSMLRYFLFYNKKGYCTYYAGATVFMLRSLGIPARMTAGFLTEDRSSKNKGWYWFYGKQAHAWTQVYFPGLGWLDFDTTVGEEEVPGRQAPMADGTPPMFPPKPWFAGSGQVVSIDTALKVVEIVMNKTMFKNKDYTWKVKANIKFDVKKAKFKREKLAKTFSDLVVGDLITGVSYNENLRKYLAPQQNESCKTFVDRLPSPLSIDEVFIQNKPETPKPKKKEEKTKLDINWAKYISILLITLSIIAVLTIVLAPFALFLYYYLRAKWTKNQNRRIYFIYRYSLYLFNQMGAPRGKNTPLAYAQNIVDPRFNINFGDFMVTYLKLKYGNYVLQEDDLINIQKYFNALTTNVLAQVNLKNKIKAFFNIANTQRFFVMPPDEDDMKL